MSDTSNKSLPGNRAEFVLQQIRTQEISKSDRSEHISRLLDRYRNYMTVLARAEMSPALQTRLDASDIVQETMFELHKNFSQFRGTTEQELLAWLRRSLIRNLLDQIKRQRAARRDIRREQRLEAAEKSGVAMLDHLCASISSPSQQVSRAEQSVRVANALASLPSDYRDVIMLRNIHRLEFRKIGEQMERSHGATRMLWLRALEAFKKAIEHE